MVKMEEERPHMSQCAPSPSQWPDQRRQNQIKEAEEVERERERERERNVGKHTVVERFLTSYKMFLAKSDLQRRSSFLQETSCKKLKSVPPLCATSSECRALFRVENLHLFGKDCSFKMQIRGAVA